MNRYLTFILIGCFLLGGCIQVFAQGYSIISIANTADVSNMEYYDHLEAYLNTIKGSYSVLINGDISNTKDHQGARILLETLNRSNAEKVIVIPGDRDWDNSGPDGWQTVNLLEKEIGSSFMATKIVWPLSKACPGPEYISISPDLGLITINTQWFNHPFNKPIQEDGICSISTEGDFLEELEGLIDENGGKNILVAGHFPVISLGKYGGFFPLSDWLLPVPILSGMITSFRQNIGRPIDLNNENFEGIGKKIISLLSQRSSLVYVSGHEKNLQVLEWDDNFFINSGSPENGQFTTNNRISLYSEPVPGLINLGYYEDGEVIANIIKYDRIQGFSNSDEIALMASACDNPSGERVNTLFSPCNTLEYNIPETPSFPVEGTVSAGAEYAASGFKRTFMGTHYRESWIKEIKSPYLDLDTTFGGLTPFARGGGRQTKSLKFKSGNGYEYVFRSVDKDPAGALSPELRETFIADILRDQTTTQQPYGALVADILLNKLNILHTHPKLYIMPDDPRLKIFRTEFGNMLGMLEERPTNPDSDAEMTFANARKIRKSFKMFKDLYEDRDNQVDQNEFIRARVFDILVGDWGKHEDNWKWAGFDSESFSGIRYRPIPRDRDHVFSRWDGLLPWLADREWAKPSGENFDYEIKGLRSLMWQARHLDRFLASEMTRLDWLDAAVYIQENIDDKTIELAVRNMPEEVYQISGNEIENKLKSRIRDLPGYAESYYRMLAKNVDIVGSVKKEFFEVGCDESGILKVSMYNITGGDKKGNKRFYEREFYPGETREVRLFGLQGNDVFDLSGINDKETPINLRLIGGFGDDIYFDSARNIKTRNSIFLYDNTGDNEIRTGKSVRIKEKADPSAYRYDRTSFAYNTYFPLLYVNYNADQGFLLGTNTSFTNHRFGKPEFSSKHGIKAEITTQGNLVAAYAARFHHIAGAWDMLLNLQFGYPNTFNYFYGIGNETIKDEDLYTSNFYRTRYNSLRGGFGFLNQFWKRSFLAINFEAEKNSEQLETNNIFTQGSENYLGGEALDIVRTDIVLDLDFRDRENLPSKGMRYFLNHEAGFTLNKDNKFYDKILTSIEQFFSTRNRQTITYGIRLGGSVTSGDIPYYHRYFLGQGENLRGYRMNRFTGDKSLFLNNELRWKFGELKTSLVPFGYGIIGFYDAGRVYLDGEVSDKWHQGYGFGFFLVPLRESYSLNISFAFSEEESALLLFSLGKSFH